MSKSDRNRASKRRSVLSSVVFEMLEVRQLLAGAAPVAVNDAFNVAQDHALNVAGPGILVNDTDADLDPLTASGNVPTTHGGISLNPDGSFDYTPNPGYFGPDSFTYHANDGSLDSNIATVTLTVNGSPTAVDDSFSTPEDTALVVVPNGVLANDTDPEGDPLTSILVANATHGNVALNPDGSFTYTPTANYNGADSFTYKANDGGSDSKVATVNLTVTAVNDAPVAVDDAFNATEDTPLVVPAAGVLANDTDVEGDPLTAGNVTQPANGSVVLNADGSFTYTPNANFNGPDTFTYTANDGTADSKAATVTVTVAAVNDAPVAVADSYRTPVDATLAPNAPAGVLANDTDADAGDTLTAVVDVGPTHSLAFTLNADGSFTYTPAVGYNGPDSFTYHANDGTANSNIVSVSIMVNSVPVANDDVGTTAEDAPLVVPALTGILANDTDADAGSTLVPTVTVQPAHGAVTVNPDGSYTYTPAANYNGPDSFTYTVSDGVETSAPATVNLTVTAVNDVPVAVADSYRTPVGVSLAPNAAAGVLANDTDADAGDTLTAVLDANVTHGALVLNADGSFTYTPTVGYSGPDSFTYHVNDGTADSNVVSVNIMVNSVPVANDDVGTTAEDTPLVVAAPGLLANDTDADAGATLTAAVASQPGHGTVVVNPDGSYTYTPAANFNGADSFTYTVSDGVETSAPAAVNLTVTAVPDAPVAVNDSYNIAVNGSLAPNPAAGVLANDTDADGDPLTAVLNVNVTHGTLVLAADGSFTYAPDAGFHGTDSFTYHANDGTADSNIATVNITVNSIPVANNDAYSTAEDAPLVVPALTGILANDTDADAGTTLTPTVTVQPANGTLTLSADGSFNYTPNANFNGADTFTYTVSDGIDTSAPATVTVTVTPVNDAPVAVDDSATTNEDTPATIAVQGNDTDVDLDTLTTLIVAAPTNGTAVVNVDGTVTYTPNANFNGADSFTYKVNDGTVDSNTATVNITVTAVNDAPVAVNDVGTTAEDTPLVVPALTGVLANDTDAESNPLTAILVTDAAHGTVVLNSDGSYTYTPVANYNGPDSFTYKANDGTSDSNVATVNLTVTSVNDVPVANNDTYNIAVSGTLTVNAAGGVLANDTDADVGATLTAVLNTDVAHGTLVLAADGSFTYTPTAGFHGNDSFTYHANDGTADSNIATVNITVNSIPVAVDDVGTTAEDTPLVVPALTGVLANDTDADADALTAAIATQPAHGTVVLNADGSYTYTPAANYNGPDSFTYTVSDGIDTSAPATVAITVTPVNDAPVATADSYVVAVNGALNVNAATGVLANDTDVDAGDTLTAILVTGPTNGVLALNPDGSFTYTPTAAFHGSDSFTYKANDGTLDSNTVTVTIAVDTAPVANDDTLTTPKNTALHVAAPGILANDTDADAGDTLTPSVVTQPAHGTLALNADGSLTYTPTTGFTGADSFTYKVNDGLLDSNTATVNITVVGANQAPVAVNDTYTVTPGGTLTTTAVNGVIANDVDADGDVLTASLGTNVAHGTLTLNADGSFTYTPTAGFTGADSFTYTVSDGQATSNVATVTLNVTAVVTNTPPTAAGFNVSHAPGAPVKFNLNPHVSDADGDTLTFSVAQAPHHGSVSINPNGVATYTPTNGFFGNDSFVYQVSDGNGGTATATVTFTTTTFGLAPSASPGKKDLIIIGTAGKDKVILTNASHGRVKAVRNGVNLGIFAVTGKVIIRAGAGNDLIDATGLKKSVAIFAGAGNDTLKGGLNTDELYGQAGNDTIIVGKFAARVIGGAGVDDVLWP